MTFTYKDSEYKMSTSLRTAFAIQSKFNHKPYMAILSGIQESTLQDQIKVLFASFELENPNAASAKEFENWILDNMNLLQIMEKVGELVEGIMYNGLSPQEIEEKKLEMALKERRAY